MNRRAFTLIELLVVISVVSLLMAILMPALAKARQQGKSSLCQSNLRQLGIAAQMYANNNDGYYPIAYMNDPDLTDTISIMSYWDFIHTNNWDANERKIEPGILWQGETTQKIQQCPVFKGSANSDDPYTGYNYNISYIGHGDREIITVPARASEVKKPGRCALFGDGEYADGANKFMRSPWKSKWDSTWFRSAGTQGFRHDGRTNVAWCDGHVSSQSECYTETLPDEKEKIERYNQTSKIKVGFLSPDDSAYSLQ